MLVILTFIKANYYINWSVLQRFPPLRKIVIGTCKITIMAVFMLEALKSSRRFFNVSDVNVVWYKNGTY